jgi:hypothetical protein
MGVELVGPFEHHAVVVDGWEVPHVVAQPVNGGEVLFELDGRFSLKVPVALVDETAWFLAQAIAVAAGWTAHPGGPEGTPRLSPYRRLRPLDSADQHHGGVA